MASKNFVQPSIPRFDDHYEHWSMLMENFLRSKDFWQVIESGVAGPAAGASEAQRKQLEELKLKDLKAKNYLFQAIDRAILETILCKTTSRDMWVSMKKKFQGSGKAKRSQLQAFCSEFEVLHMKTGESVADYLSRTMAIANKLRIFGEAIEDSVIVGKILRKMTPKYEYVLCSITESNDLDEISLDDLESSLNVHEQRMNQQVGEEQALHTANFSRGKGRGRGRGKGYRERGNSQSNSEDKQPAANSQGRGRGRGRGGYHSTAYRPKSADMSNVECYRCHKYGHYKSTTSQNVEVICLKDKVRNLILQKRKKKYLC